MGTLWAHTGAIGCIVLNLCTEEHQQAVGGVFSVTH